MTALAQPERDHLFTREYAVEQDNQDPLRHLRQEFLIPSKACLDSRTLQEAGASKHASSDPCTYLCGNSLGLQPRRTAERIQQYLTTWATQGVFGHFKPLSNSPLYPWLHVDDQAAEMIAPIVGAERSEVAVMGTLTANLHILMSAFYHPDAKGRHKIILESKAFPSDHYAVESQIRHHGLEPSTSMITIEPASLSSPLLGTEQILDVITQHADTTALLLLPGVQYYSGQFFDIPTITAHAQSLGIFVIWDLAHAVGNVPLQLHDWNVDAATWCSYKYLNGGPGNISGLFVHDRHSTTNHIVGAPSTTAGMINRLSGWWGSDKQARFHMTNHFAPLPGAPGFQLSNPSILDCTALCASLEIFARTDLSALRAKSLRLTAYLETLLRRLPDHDPATRGTFAIITSADPAQRGAQLSIRLAGGLHVVMRELERRAVVVDERKPDVIRVAPAPLYNGFGDVYTFVDAFARALVIAKEKQEYGGHGEGTDELLQTS